MQKIKGNSDMQCTMLNVHQCTSYSNVATRKAERARIEQAPVTSVKARQGALLPAMRSTKVWLRPESERKRPRWNTSILQP